MSQMFDKLKAQVEENPLGAATVGALAVTAVTSLMRANTARRNSKAWTKEVNRRVKKQMGR